MLYEVLVHCSVHVAAVPVLEYDTGSALDYDIMFYGADPLCGTPNHQSTFYHRNVLLVPGSSSRNGQIPVDHNISLRRR
jgi:hypothetical protein